MSTMRLFHSEKKLTLPGHRIIQLVMLAALILAACAAPTPTPPRPLSNPQLPSRRQP